MFDYIDRMRLALGDKARRTGMKAAAVAALLIGSGFLLAAAWSWIAWGLELGPIGASLVIGGIFALAGMILWGMAATERHKVPGTEDLKNEVSARLNLAAEAAIGKVRHGAETVMDSAQTRVSSLFGIRGGAAEGADGDSRDGGGNPVSEAAETVGEALKDARETLDRAVATKAGPAIGLAGAFALGVMIASAMKGRREDDGWDDWDEDWDGDGDYS